MVNEQRKTLEGLETAIQMETDGKEFYLKASRESSNEMGKELLSTLAGEEDIHREKFKEIYEALRDKKGWPEVDFPSDGGKRLKTVFAQATKKMGTEMKASATELDAVQTAMSMENKTYDFYRTQSKNSIYDAEKDFYEALATEERTHFLLLLDYYEYLKDPAAWFVSKEHPSLDGV